VKEKKEQDARRVGFKSGGDDGESGVSICSGNFSNLSTNSLPEKRKRPYETL